MLNSCNPRGALRCAQVAIIGGGPAGSVAAARLAQLGISAVVLERERFPRFHIGESLLPNGNAILKKIGVWEKVQAAGFVEKRAAQFTLPDRSSTVRNVFAQGMMPGMEMTYHVERARFDELLLRHAEELGAATREETTVLSAKRSSGKWALETIGPEGPQRMEADWVIDASGRNSFMGRTLGLPREELPYPGRVAVYNHFRGATRDAGESAGDVIVLRVEDAWFWSIPISATTTSVGVVLQSSGGKKKGESLEDVFWRKVRESSGMSAMLKHATPLAAYTAESDYSFSHTQFGAQRVLLAGDAASFIDPVFSSGVYLALESGVMAAEAIDRCQRHPRCESRVYAAYTKELKGRISAMRRLIDAFYDADGVDVFISPRQQLKVPQAVNSILAGCLKPTFAVRWRLWLFGRIVALHKRFPLVPKIDWAQVSTRNESRAETPSEKPAAWEDEDETALSEGIGSELSTSRPRVH